MSLIHNTVYLFVECEKILYIIFFIYFDIYLPEI